MRRCAGLRAGSVIRVAVWLITLVIIAATAGCGGNNDEDPTTSFSGQAFSNAVSRGRAPLPLADAAITITRYATGESLATATTDDEGAFAATIPTLPPGTVILITAAANAGGALTMQAQIPMPTAGAVVRVDPETTIATLGVGRLIAAGAARSIVTADVASQVLNAVRAATASGAVDLDTVDFRSTTEVEAAIDAALGPSALVTSNARARVYVDGVDTGQFVPHFAPNLVAGAHLFRVQTSTQSSESSVNVPDGGAAWVDLTIISGGGTVPNHANYGGSMPFNVNDETIQSPAAGVSVSPVEGMPDCRHVTISLHGVNEDFLSRAINVSGVAEVSADTLVGAAGTESGSTLRADFVSATGTVTQYSEPVESALFSLTFNADGTVTFYVNANSAMLMGNASGTLEPMGP
jgi:hypothetical protein